MVICKFVMEDCSSKKIEELLINYQQIAMSSLGGPASSWASSSTGKSAFVSPHRFAGNILSKPLLPNSAELPFDFKLPFTLPVAPPIFLQPDLDADIRGLIHCELEGVDIAGFDIGGEERLCLPLILNTILKEIDLNVINEACDRLCIHCSHCTDHQLRVLKREEILPPHVSSAGLMTKTDAERLCTRLLHSKPAKVIDPDQRIYPQINNTCLPVYHECFGEGHGFLYTELYTNSYARCIACADCDKLFTPERFVTHSHFNQENRICHWGFNRRNWRSYLLMCEDEVTDNDLDTMMKVFNDVLDKFKHGTKKRKAAVAASLEEPCKPFMKLGAERVLAASSPTTKRRCNRAPMRAYEYVKEDPKVENPDQVVSRGDVHLYAKHYVPNICLRMSPHPSAASEVEEEALDLRSPTQRERHISVSSSVSSSQTDTKQGSVVEKQTTESVNVQPVNGSDELDVVSINDSEAAGDDTDRDVMSCIQQMEDMFLQVLKTSSMSDDDKDTKRRSFADLVTKLRKSM